MRNRSGPDLKGRHYKGNVLRCTQTPLFYCIWHGYNDLLSLSLELDFSFNWENKRLILT